MALSTDRPVNLDLGTFRFPITAIASIMHRISGVILFFGSFILLALLGCRWKARPVFLTPWLYWIIG